MVTDRKWLSGHLLTDSHTPQSRDAIASKKNKQMFRRCAKVIRIVVVNL